MEIVQRLQEAVGINVQQMQRGLPNHCLECFQAVAMLRTLADGLMSSAREQTTESAIEVQEAAEHFHSACQGLAKKAQLSHLAITCSPLPEHQHVVLRWLCSSDVQRGELLTLLSCRCSQAADFILQSSQIPL